MRREAKSETRSTQPKGETEAHLELKRRALCWLAGQGCGVRATEVRLPLSRYRADVVGYRRNGRAGTLGDTFALECKQDRSDFLRDAGLEASACAERLALQGERERLAEALRAHLPDCRCGLSLFAEFDAYDFSELRHAKWRRLVRQLDVLERRMREGVKFSRMARYGVATYAYLVVADGVLRSLDEVPTGWGCLGAGEAGGLDVLRPACRLASRADVKLRLLERMATRLSGDEVGANRNGPHGEAVVGEVDQLAASDDGDHPLAGE